MGIWLFGRNNFGQCGMGDCCSWDDGLFNPYLFQSLTEFKDTLVSSANVV